MTHPNKPDFEVIENPEAELTRLLDHTRYALYRVAPFFGAALARVDAVFSNKISTACIDGRKIYINPDFWKNDLTPNQRKGVLAHEIGHMLFGHLWRRGRRDPQLSNQAMDYALNLILIDECGFELPSWVLYDKQYADKAWEEIYDILFKKQNNSGGGGMGMQSPNANGTGDIDPFDNRGGNGQGQQQLDTHDFWDSGDPEEAAQQEQHWKGVTTASWMHAKKQGKLPAGIDRLVGKGNKPPIDWYAALYRYVQQAEVSDESWNPPDRRWAAEDIWFPADRPDETLRDVYACFDTSGSVSMEELQLYLSNVEGIMRNFPRTKGRLLVGDAAVHYEGDLDKYMLKKYPGGGGTDFRPFFERVEENQKKGRKVSALVFFTDGYGSYPEHPPKYPVIWVITSGYDRVPWGTVVHVNV